MQHEPVPVVVIEPRRGWVGLGLGALWEFRELLFFLIWRDLKVRYRQTALGVLWAIVQPVTTMVVFSLFLHNLASVPSEGQLPYPIFAFAGLMPWQYFSAALSGAAGSVIGSAALIRKVAFPRAIVPLASALGGLVDFAVAFLVFLVLMLWYRIAPTPAILLLPFFLLLAIASAVGAGLWLAALGVHYRDVRYLVPFLLQVWLFATPVAYPSSLVSAPWRMLYSLNPMAGVVDGFRWTLLGIAPPGVLLLVSASAGLALFVSGLLFFRRMERGFADVI